MTTSHCIPSNSVTSKILVKNGISTAAITKAEIRIAPLNHLFSNVCVLKIDLLINLELKAWNNWINPKVRKAIVKASACCIAAFPTCGPTCNPS